MKTDRKRKRARERFRDIERFGNSEIRRRRQRHRERFSNNRRFRDSK